MTNCALVAIAVCWSILHSQVIPPSPKMIKDSKGKDFWLGFPRNHHQTNINLDRLYISIAAERPTRGTITFWQYGNKRTETFTVAAQDIYTLELPVQGLEIEGNTIARRSFHITTDEEVSVYGLSVANTTSDAFLAFPTDVLGREYVITSYPSNLVFQGRFVNTVVSTMSQFAVLAVEDSTVVHIFPTARVWDKASIEPFTLTLNQGETYLISNSLEAENAQLDYTGSRILSSKPLVVYAGHERAAIPIGVGTSRDYLIEQMLPVEVWGKTALVVPYPTPTLGTADFGCDRIRVVAAYDNTVVSVNGATVATLRAGTFYEMIISTEASIATSEPSMIAGYKCSSAGVRANISIGDPFLAVIPPVEQYLNRYRFTCVQGVQVAQNALNRFEPAFQEHYVTIIVPSTRATTVTLDGRTLPPQSFKRISHSEYSYSTIPISEGTHSITADTTFGITVAGYGRANSYGYIGGQRFETDIRPPQIVVQRTCTGIRGMIYDSTYTDSKIFFYDTLWSAQRNIAFRFGTLPRPADSLAFHADLLNPFEDGTLGIVAVDSLDLRTVQRITVPGFTVHRDPTVRTRSVGSARSVLRLATGREYCFRLLVTNYGSTHQTIQHVSFAQGRREFSARMQQPLHIEPSSQGTIEYCFRTDEDGVFIDTLVISNGCITRPILALYIEAAADRFPPTVALTSDSCNRTVVLETSDNRTFDSGIESIEISLSNFRAQQSFIGVAALVPDSTKRPIRLVLTVVNPRADAVYHIRIRDSVGNIVVLRDTIRGFTLRFLTHPDTSSGVLQPYVSDTPEYTQHTYRFAATEASSLTCATLYARNTGIAPFVLDYPYIHHNTVFSLPLSQFPLIIPPGEMRLLRICFQPPLVALYRDTIAITRFCITERIALSGEGLSTGRFAGTRCDITARLTPRYGSTTIHASRHSSGLRVSVFPTPAHNHLTLRIDTEEEQDLAVRLISLLGTTVASMPSQRFSAGTWELTLHFVGIDSGAYYCEVESHTPSIQRWTRLVHIVR
ncbi:MAG: IgGFc-binding protein [Bacteroidota bacterium]|nr:IgGFc-binding protein [Candidatus Kapabacteria bacterium]MDW8219131.1 IgGFc-binding protein [Bacteroidota bacterium]